MHLHKKQRIIMDFAKCIFIFLPNEKMKQETFTASLEILIIYKEYPSLQCLPINGQPGHLVITECLGPLGPLIIFLIQSSKGKEGEITEKKQLCQELPTPYCVSGSRDRTLLIKTRKFNMKSHHPSYVLTSWLVWGKKNKRKE